MKSLLAEISCLILILGFQSTITDSNRTFSSNNRNKVRPFFLFVRIPKESCTTDTNPSRSGVCVSSKECRRIKGTSSGTCAEGYGTCCVVILNGGDGKNPEIVRANGTHIMNPVNMMNQTTYEYRFPRLNDVCQVRLDFIHFQTNAGDVYEVGDYGNCQDTLNFAGTGNTRNLAPLCGNLTGQHVILDYGTNSVVSLYSHIDNAERRNQGWDIQVTFFKCHSTELAPAGCLQYFTQPSASVTSFNFPTMQMNNHYYTVCIKPLNGMNKITWSQCGGLNGFVISGMWRAPLDPPLPPQHLNGSECKLDWVMIYGENKYCGEEFNGPVTAIAQPFMLGIHFNEFEVDSANNDDRNTGFCLQYVQSP